MPPAEPGRKVGEVGFAMMKKGDRIEAYIRSLGLEGEYDPCYLAYFACFNDQEYYEAHDVLEHLWLREKDHYHAFYKGLIQLAGAFVHLKKQYLRPWHPKDAGRMRPAVRLFALAVKNIRPYAPECQGLDIGGVVALADGTVDRIVASDYSVNPWNPSAAPSLHLGGRPSSFA